MPEITNWLSGRGELLCKFQKLSGQIDGQVRKPGDVATRMGEALDDSYGDWIAYWNTIGTVEVWRLQAVDALDPTGTKTVAPRRTNSIAA